MVANAKKDLSLKHFIVYVSSKTNYYIKCIKVVITVGIFGKRKVTEMFGLQYNPLQSAG